MKEVKLPEKIQKGVDMEQVLSKVLKLMSDNLVRKIFASKPNIKRTKRLIKKNVKLTPREIIEVINKEFTEKVEEKKTDVVIDEKKLSVIDKFIAKLDKLDNDKTN